MPKRIAKIKQDYAGRSIAAGEEFEVEDEHIDILLKIGSIEPDGNIEEFQASMGSAQTALYATRDMQSARAKPHRSKAS